MDASEFDDGLNVQGWSKVLAAAAILHLGALNGLCTVRAAGENQPAGWLLLTRFHSA